MAWLADGRLAFGSADGTVPVWEIDSEVWITQACRCAGRNLTQVEWQQYVGDEPYTRTCPDLPPEQGSHPTRLRINPNSR